MLRHAVSRFSNHWKICAAAFLLLFGAVGAQGQTLDVIPDMGPLNGGNIVLVTNAVPAIGTGANITNVLIGGTTTATWNPSPEIIGQGTNWVRFIAPPGRLAGVATNLRVQAAGMTARTTNRVYTYYPRGTIGSQTGRWRTLGQAPVPDSTNAFGMAGGVTRVRALHWDHERNVMFAGGTFTNAGGVNMDGVAYWDGAAWNRMGGGIGTTRYVNGFLPAPDGKVYAHGFFPTIGNATSRNVGAWNEDVQEWESLGEGVTFGVFSVGNVNQLHWIAPTNIIAVGNFTNISATLTTPNKLGNVARWNGSEWGRMDPAGDFVQEVHCLAVSPGINPLMPEGELYVGGWFTNHYPLETSQHMHGMARWDEAASTWHPVGWGITGAARRVRTMMFCRDGNLYVGGNFTHARNADGTEVEANRVAMWNGSVWTNLGEGAQGNGFGWDNVYDMAQCNDGYIYAVGDFTNIGFRTAGGPAVNGFARWDGTNWSAVGAGLNHEVWAITINTNNNDIYVGGRFTYGLHEDGSVAHTWRVARWDWDVPYHGVEPASGALAGGYTITISGRELGSGTDITNVVLAGVQATIVSQSETQVVVTAGSTDIEGPGAVEVFSTSRGRSVKEDAFTYEAGQLADVLAGWRLFSSGHNTNMYVTAHTTHPGLVSATMNYRVTNNFNARSNPRFATYKDTNYFYLEPWFTGTLVETTSATNQFAYVSGKPQAISNYVEYAFMVPAGYKIVITNFMTRMMNDERRLHMMLRTERDDWKTNIAYWVTTNFYRIYTNEVRFGDGAFESKDPVTRIRLYGSESRSKWVYAYWNALGQKIPCSKPACAAPPASAYPPGAGTYMMLFQGLVVPLADVYPNNGPLEGGNFVLVTNAFLTNGISNADITNVVVDGKSVAPGGEQGTNWFTFTAPPGDSPGEKDMVVYSTSKGATMLSGSYTYNPSGVIVQVSPTGGVAGIEVTIRGQNFCNEAGDVTNVLFGNARATPSSVSSTQLVVNAPSGGGVSPIKIYSTSYGLTEKLNGFTYDGPATAPELVFLGTNGAVIGSGSAAVPAAGADFGGILRGLALTNTFSITNAGTAELTISGVTTSGAGAAYFRVVERPSSVMDGARADFKVAFDAAVAGTHTAVVQIASDDGLSPFVLHLAGTTVPGHIGTVSATGVSTVGVFSATQAPNQPGPISLQYTSYRQQHLYSAATLAGAGLTDPVQITAVGFDVAQAASPHVVSNYRMQFAETERADWSADSVMQSSGLEAVYSNAAAVFAVGASPDLTLDAAFYLRTNTALLVDCAFARPGAATSLDGRINVVTVPRGMVYSSDGTANSVTNLVPRMVFAWQAMSDPGVSPAMCPSTGGVEVTISGVHLCDGTMGDIARVTLNGAAATVLAVNGSTQIVVRAGDGGTIGRGAVEVVSAKYGRTAVANIFTYNAPGEIGRDWAEEGWSAVPGLPYTRTAGGLGVISNKLYYISGATKSWWARTNVYRFDDTVWTEVQGTPAQRKVFGYDVFNGQAYLVGGDDQYSAVTNVFRFDGTQWTETLGLPAPRATLGAAVLDGALYAIGGDYGVDTFTNVFKYDGATWTEVAGLPEGRVFFASTVASNKLYVISGRDGTATARYNVYVFDGTSWTEIEPIPVRSSAFAAATLNDVIYVFGGGAGTNTLHFDGAQWQVIGGPPTSLNNTAAAVYGNYIYAVGNSSSTNAYRYGPAGFTAPGVVPSEGLAGETVTISGRNLSAGTMDDVTSVTLCGAAATVQSVSGSTQIVVTAGANAPGIGDVVVQSVLYGRTMAEDAFNYAGVPDMVVLGTNGQPIASGADAAITSGTDFGIMKAGQDATHTLSITNPGLVELNISGVTTNEP